MKKLIILILLFFSLQSFAQTGNIYLSLQPVDFGIGIRFDKKIFSNGFYLSYTRGSYGMGEGFYIHKHQKFTVGLLQYISQDEFPGSAFSIGLCYNTYGNYNAPPNMTDKALDKFSFELGAKTSFTKRLSIGLRYDFYRNESSVDLGINF